MNDSAHKSTPPAAGGDWAEDAAPLAEFREEELSEPDAISVFAEERSESVVAASRETPTSRHTRSWRMAIAAGVVAAAALGAYMLPAAKPTPLKEQIAKNVPSTAESAPSATVADAGIVVPPAAVQPEPRGETSVNDARPLLSGEWAMSTRVESSRLTRYEGLRLGYRLRLRQDGNRISGTGWKITEGDRRIGSTAQTPITFQGFVTGDRVELLFTERGRLRASAGKLVVAKESDDVLRGRFSSNAAQSSGVVEIRRASRTPV